MNLNTAQYNFKTLEETHIFTSIPSLIAPLATEIFAIKKSLHACVHPHLKFALLFGSCVRGQATWRSDIDIMFFMQKTTLNYTYVKEIRDWFEKNIEDKIKSHPLPIQLTVVLEASINSQEIAMQTSLREGILIYSLNTQEDSH